MCIVRYNVGRYVCGQQGDITLYCRWGGKAAAQRNTCFKMGDD